MCVCCTVVVCAVRDQHLLPLPAFITRLFTYYFYPLIAMGYLGFFQSRYKNKQALYNIMMASFMAQEVLLIVNDDTELESINFKVIFVRPGLIFGLIGGIAVTHFPSTSELRQDKTPKCNTNAVMWNSHRSYTDPRSDSKSLSHL